MMRHLIVKTSYEYVHLVVGDGCQPGAQAIVRRESLDDNFGRLKYSETRVAEGFYGTAPRNLGLELVESGRYGQIDYVIFLDDDNLLLEPALYNLNATIRDNNFPPLVWHDIIFTNKYTTDYKVFPLGGKPVVQGDWDSLSGIYKLDAVRGLRWEPVYEHDFLFAKAAQEKANASWVKCPGIGAVHCVSWDTYEQEKKI